MGQTAFAYSCRLSKLVFPPTVTSIATQAFNNMYMMSCYDFSQHTAVPTLSNTNAFGGIPSDCVFKIPTSLYDEWINATNWSAIAATNTFVGV
jgi:hypothetical protein